MRLKKTRRVLALPGAILGIAMAGCAGEDAGSRVCEDRVEIRFNAWREGDYAFDGAVGDRPFSCELWLEISDIGENPGDFHFGGNCSGAALLDDRRLVIEGPPATITWTATWTDPLDSTVQETRSGQDEPDPGEDGACPTARAVLPRW